MKFITFLFLLLLISCDGKKQEKEIVKTKIDSLKVSHWGKGYFKNTLYFSFTYQEEKFQSSYKSNIMLRVGGSYYKNSDLIIISFPKSNPKEAKVLDKIFP